MASASGSSGGPLLIQAREQMDMAAKELAKWTMFSSAEKWEKAGGHYRSAGNFFKASMKWEDATKAYNSAAELFAKLRETAEEVDCLREASMCMTHHDAKRAAAMMEASVIPRMVEAGKLSEVAKMHKEIGDVLRDDDMDAALDHYRRAADMYTSAGSATDALKCNLFVAAELASRMEYDAAIPLFVEAAKVRLAKELTRLSARDHFLDAGICVLAKDDSVHANECFERWCGMDYTFEDSREGKLFRALIQTLEERKPDDFAEAVFAFDSIKKLTPWRTKILLRAKEVVSGAGDLEDELA